MVDSKDNQNEEERNPSKGKGSARSQTLQEPSKIEKYKEIIENAEKPPWWKDKNHEVREKYKEAIANWATEVSKDQIYRFMIRYYIYQDQLSWSRTQMLVVIEAGLLAASYKCADTPLAMVILVFGTIIVGLIWQLIKRDWEIRDQYLGVWLDTIHNPLGIQMTTPAKHWINKGFKIVRLVVWLLVIVNICLIACYFLMNYCVCELSCNLRTFFGL